ncbi:alpha/beta hydrolase [Acidovorax sp. NCPPB 2350]|nr:alpha/beta hydrolase [Acidovorax sp. NCPPB 2350]
MQAAKSLLAATALTIAAGAAHAQPERHTQSFLNALAAGGGKPLEQLTPQEARAVLEGAQSSVKLVLPPAEVSEKRIPVEGGEVLLKIVRPKGAKGQVPAFMFIHGGGWVLGDFPTHERLIRDLVASSGAAAVYVDYTRSPEAGYGVAIRQAYDATRWVAENGRQIGVDGSRLAVAGNSVGGNMAAVVSLMAKEKGTPKIRFQALLWPVTDANFDTPSYQQYESGYFLTRNMMKWFWDNYTTDAAKRKEIHASPLQASTEQLQGLPPALIQTAELDVLRDEAEAYGRKLDAAGVDVVVTRYNGMIHDFGLLNPLAHLAGTRAAMEQAGAELRRHLR